MRKNYTRLLLGIGTALLLTGCSAVPTVSTATEEETTEVSLTEQIADGSILEKDDSYNYKYLEDVNIGQMVFEWNSFVGVDLKFPAGDGFEDNGTIFNYDNYGVSLELTLNPSISKSKRSLPVYEKLRSVVEDEYGSSQNFNKLQMSGVEDLKNELARVTVSYMNDNSDGITLIDNTYAFITFDEYSDVVLKVAVNYNEATDETIELIEEIENYYGFSVAFDEENAAKVLEEYLVEKDKNSIAVRVGSISTRLPENWVPDEDDPSMYLPEGTTYIQTCAVCFGEYNAGVTLSKNDLLELEQALEEIMKESYGSKFSNFEMEDHEDTFLGATVKATYDIQYSRGTQKWITYFGIRGSKLYLVGAVNTPGAKEDAYAALEYAMQRGSLR